MRKMIGAMAAALALFATSDGCARLSRAGPTATRPNRPQARLRRAFGSCTGGRNGDKSISATRGKAESTQAFTLLSRSRERMRAVDNPRGRGDKRRRAWKIWRKSVASRGVALALYVDYELTFLGGQTVSPSNRCRYAHALDEQRRKIYLSV